MKELFEKLALNMPLLVIGFVGAIIHTFTHRQQSFARGLLKVVTGTLSANYLTPLMMHLLDINMDAQYGVAFFLGYSGLKTIEMLMDKMKTKL